MARSRNIKPGFFQNEDLGELTPLDRLAFIGMWTICDYKGCFELKFKRLKIQLLPYDECNIEEIVINLEQAGFIRAYSVLGRSYIKIVNFQKHQNPHKNEVSMGSDIPDIGENQENLGSNGEKPDKIGTKPDKIGTAPADSLLLIPDSFNPLTDSRIPQTDIRPAAHCSVVDAVVAELVLLTGKAFDPQAKYCGGLRARIAEGATLEVLLGVVRAKHSQWAEDPKMSRYIHPETLFRPENFEKYILEVTPSGEMKKPETFLEKSTREFNEEFARAQRA